MEQRTTQEARKQFAALLEDVLRGERIRITRYGRPLAVMVPDDWYTRACAALGEPVPEFIPVTEEKAGEKK